MSKFVMKMMPFFERLWSWLKPVSPERRQKEKAVNEAIEQVVNQVDPRIRGLMGYQRKLFPAVERALDYSSELAQRIPGPIQVDRQSWGKDPLVNSLFGSMDKLRWCLTGSEVRKFLKTCSVGTDQCYGLLMAFPHARNRLGMDLAGDQVRRDVKQTVMSFTNQQVVLPGESEAEVRAAVVHGLLDTIVGLVMQEMSGQEERIAASEDLLRMLRLKRKVLGPQVHGIDLLRDGNEAEAEVQEYESLGKQIAEVERDLTEHRRGLETLDDYLDRLAALLLHPERVFGADLVKVRMDRMNIVREGKGEEEMGREVEFLRGRRHDQPGRVSLLIRFPRSEVIDEKERRAEMELYANL